MQEPGSVGGGGGGEEEGERSGQDSPPVPEDQGSSGSSSAGDGRDDYDDDDDDDDVHEPRGPQDPGNEDNPVEGAPVQPGPVDEEAAGEPQGEQPPIPSGPGGDAAMGIASRLMELCVMIHFRSPLEANLARRSLILGVGHQEEMFQQEFTVTNSALTIKWMTEDLALFQDSINNFLDQLSEVMRLIYRLELASVARERGNRRRET